MMDKLMMDLREVESERGRVLEHFCRHRFLSPHTLLMGEVPLCVSYERGTSVADFNAISRMKRKQTTHKPCGRQ